MLPSYRASRRLIFDFEHGKSLGVQSIVQVLAARLGGEAPNSVYSSFGNSPRSKRKTTHITLPSSERTEDHTLMSEAKETLRVQGLGEVVVGWNMIFYYLKTHISLLSPTSIGQRVRK